MVSSDSSVADGVSRKKQLANQRNARKSTGPRTDEGKAVSSQNATTHGFYARHIVTADEDSAEFNTYKYNMIRRLEPRDELELEYADQFIAAGWKLKRLRMAEVRMLDGRVDQKLEDLRGVRESIGSDEPVTLQPGAAAVVLAQDIGDRRSAFVRYQTYEQRLQNMMNRALKQIRMLQKENQHGILNQFTSDLIMAERGETKKYENEPTDSPGDVSDDPAGGYDEGYPSPDHVDRPQTAGEAPSDDSSDVQDGPPTS